MKGFDNEDKIKRDFENEEKLYIYYTLINELYYLMKNDKIIC